MASAIDGHPMPSKWKSVLPDFLQASLVLSLVTVFVKVLGFAEKVVLAKFYGTSAQIDAYFCAVGVIGATCVIVRETIEPSFLPMFMQMRERREEAGFYHGALTRLAIAVGAVLLVLWVGALPITRLVAPGLAVEAKDLTSSLLRVMLPAAFLISLSTVTTLALNSYRQFAIPALGEAILKASLVFTAVFLSARLGILALPAGWITGSLMLLALHLALLRRHLPMPRLRLMMRSPELLQMSARSLWPLLGVCVSQVAGLADNAFASTIGEGRVAAWQYARKLFDLPILLLPYAMSVVVYPQLAQCMVRRDRAAAGSTLFRVVQTAVLLMTPILVFLVSFSTDIVRVAFSRGQFDEQSVVLTAQVLRFLAPALLCFTLDAFVVPYFYAAGDVRTPTLVGVSCVALHLGLVWYLIQPLGPAGLAVALAISKTVKVLMLVIILGLRRELPIKSSLVSLGLKLLYFGPCLWLLVNVSRAAVRQMRSPLLNLLMSLAITAAWTVVLAWPLVKGVRSRFRWRNADR